MNSQQLKVLLNRLRACKEAVEWTDGKDLKTAWETCEHADWMLWLCARMIGKEGWPIHQQVVLAACACAETALKYVPKDELRPKQAIVVARKWANGQASLDEVKAAAKAAAWAAEAAWAEAWAAAEAAEAAWAAAWAAKAAWAEAWAAKAAEAAAWAAKAAAWAAAACKEQAVIVRKELRPVVIYGKG